LPVACADGDNMEARAHMQRLLDHFVTACGADPAMRRFAEGRDVTLHFQLVDLDLEFHLRLSAGEVGGGLGAPPERAPVELRLRAAVLDGMFSGRGDPMRDAMEGRLSFTGDAAKAMALQEMQADLQRVYLASIDAIGAPPALDGLAEDWRATFVKYGRKQ